MKNFIVRLGIFFVIIVIIDICTGICFDFLQKNAKGGDTWRQNKIAWQTNEDILIFGSSRAIHHYNPIIFQESFGLSCYNCGQDGNGILLSYGRLKMINERYYPNIIVYDITPSFDLLAESDNRKHLDWLRPYYRSNPTIDTIFWDIDKTEKIKMLSRMFQYNSKFIQIANDNIKPQQSAGIQGFRPVNQTMKYEPEIKVEEQAKYQYDSLKIKYLKKIITETRGKTNLIFTVSPMYRGIDSNVFAPIKEICKQENIPFLDYSNDPEISTNRNYFYDRFHLNSEGADYFTTKFVHDIDSLGILKSRKQRQ